MFRLTALLLSLHIRKRSHLLPLKIQLPVKLRLPFEASLAEGVGVVEELVDASRTSGTGAGQHRLPQVAAATPLWCLVVAHSRITEIVLIHSCRKNKKVKKIRKLKQRKPYPLSHFLAFSEEKNRLRVRPICHRIVI